MAIFERRKLTLKENILLALACALFFSVILAITGPLASHQTSDKIAAFAADGATTTGKVTGKRMEIVPVSKVWLWWLDIEFKTDKGQEISDSKLVYETLYDRYTVGDPVRVTYVRSEPYWNYIPGMAPKASDIGMFNSWTKYSWVAAGVSFIGILVTTFSGKSDGAPKVRIPTAKPAAPAPSPAPQGPRMEFGARRRA